MIPVNALTLEKVVFNILMYSIMLIGVLASAAVHIVVMLSGNARIAWCNLILIPGVLAGVTLCHFLYHRASAYEAEYGGKEVKEYEQRLRLHSETGLFVGLANVGVLLALTIFFVLATISVASVPSENYWETLYFVAALLAFIGFLFLFITSKHAGESGWKSVN